jgi:hypothetical protein
MTLPELVTQHEREPIIHDLPPVPDELPACHLGDSRAFKRHSERLSLAPSYCDNFEKELVYLFYGGLFFRRDPRPTRKAALLPFGFVFHSDILRHMDCFYPFDTGAVKAGRYTSTEVNELWRECCFPAVGDGLPPRLLVRYLFGTNSRYFKGLVSQKCSSLGPPLSWLIKHMKEDNTHIETDQRQYRIECQSTKEIPLKSLLWAGYPDIYTPWFGRIFDSIGPHVKRHPYDAYIPFRPTEMAAVLQQSAHEFVRALVGPR